MWLWLSWQVKVIIGYVDPYMPTQTLEEEDYLVYNLLNLITVLDVYWLGEDVNKATVADLINII